MIIFVVYLVLEANLITDNSSEKYTFPSTNVNKYGALVVMPTKNYTDKGNIIQQRKSARAQAPPYGDVFLAAHA